jgi:Major tropism determinant N-terminal domain
MPTQVQFRRGTTAQNNSFTGAAGELSVNTSNSTIRVHDGSTAGGSELATVVYASNVSNFSTGTLSATRLANTGVSASTYGSATVIPVIAVDAQGRITSASNVTSTAATTGKAIAMSMIFGF